VRLLFQPKTSSLEGEEFSGRGPQEILGKGYSAEFSRHHCSGAQPSVTGKAARETTSLNFFPTSFV
jgi:hypothetical protein